MKRKNPNLTDENIRSAFRQNRNPAWAIAYVSGGDGGTSPVCVSKVFIHLTRRMASYHRCKNRRGFDEVVEELRDLARIA